MFLECLLCAKHYAKCFLYRSPFNAMKTLWESFPYSHSIDEETEAYRGHMVPELEVESSYSNLTAGTLNHCATIF